MSLIIYGDIHGCYDEFISLRKKINPQKQDIEICVGDVITKGESSIKVLRYLQKHNIKSVLGNHEDKILRYLQHQKSDKKNPMILDEDEQELVNNLNQSDIEFLKSMPLFMQFNRITILHGGVLNHFDLNNLTKRGKQQVLRLRYMDKDGNFLAYGKENEYSKFWSETYNGDQGFIVYGHQWFSEVKKDKYSVGIDTGCVYGNKLSAIKFTDTKNIKYKIYSISCNS